MVVVNGVGLRRDLGKYIANVAIVFALQAVASLKGIAGLLSVSESFSPKQDWIEKNRFERTSCTCRLEKQ
jgi:hypothetical protein